MHTCFTYNSNRRPQVYQNPNVILLLESAVRVHFVSEIELVEMINAATQDRLRSSANHTPDISHRISTTQEKEQYSLNEQSQACTKRTNLRHYTFALHQDKVNTKSHRQ